MALKNRGMEEKTFFTVHELISVFFEKKLEIEKK